MITTRLILIAALLLSASAAHSATVYTVCSEDVSCVFQGTVTVSSTAGHFEAGVARQAMQPSTASTTVLPANRIDTNAFSSASGNFWTSANYRANTVTTSNAIMFGWTDSSVTRLLLRGTGTNQQIKLSTRNAAGTITDLVTATGTLCITGSVCKLDVHIVYAVAGSVDVYSSGVNILTYSGDVTTNSATTLNGMYAGSLNSAGNVEWSQIFAADTDTRSMKSYTCAPSAAGATQNWTGSAGNINAASYSDVTFNYTVTNNDQSQWKSGCSIPTSGTTSVVDVASFARLAVGSTGPQNGRFSFNESSTDYDNGSDLSGLTTSFGNIKYDWGATSPATSSAWTPTELNTIFTTGGFGIKSRP